MKKNINDENTIVNKVLVIRGEKVILDLDLAKHYGVTIKKLKDEVKQNIDRFPKDYVFKLNAKEKTKLAEHYEHLSDLKNTRTRPYAFTEEGAIMAARVLNNMRSV